MAATPQESTNRLQMRDLITTGIISAVFFAGIMVSGAILGFVPGLSIFAMVPAAFLLGPIFVFLAARVPKPGAISILGVIIAILTFLLGFFWLYPVASIILGIVADLISAAGKYRSKKLVVLGYVIYSISPIGSSIMPWINRDAYTAYLVGSGADQAFMDALYASLENWMVPVMFVGTMVMAFLGALLGMRLIKKQFEKAGIV